jgi:trans-aconitate methyltransferase
MTDLAEFWQSVEKGHRHITSFMPEEKKLNIIRGFEYNLLRHIPKNGLSSAIDWGVGGGLSAKILAKRFQLYVVDISEDSIYEANKYVPDIYKSILLPTDLSKFDVDLLIDVVHCSNVIHHMPSLNYLSQVISIWKSFNPSYIIINVKIGKVTEAHDYFEGNNYVEGIVVDKKYITESFEEFNLINYTEEKAVNSNAIFGFFVFKRRNI